VLPALVSAPSNSPDRNGAVQHDRLRPYGFEASGTRFSWELKSVNARGLEIRLRLPPGLDHLEPDIRNRVRDSIARGSCFFALQKDTESEVAAPRPE
jgi:uncharacterized protein YicC (UPF0701 family)